MKKILKIAKVELNVLFYSPVAWLLLAVFVVQCGVLIFDGLLGIRTALSSGYPVGGSITRGLLGPGQGGLARNVLDSLYMYMPILTMGLMSRETSSGSIKLLQSSPVRIHEIVLGKYLAVIIFGLGFLATVAFYDLIGIYVIRNADTGMMLGQLLGIYLLICAYAAIGLFMSCLTNYQIVAFISTIAVFAVMRYIGTVWQDIDFVRDLTYFLSISGRPDKMAYGLLTTKDICYFLIVIASFLMLCGLKLKSAIESRSWSVRAARYAALAACGLTLGYVTSRQSLIGYLDLTALKVNTISRQSQAIAGKIQGDLKMTSYGNLMAPAIWNLWPSQRNADLDAWEAYRRFIPGLQMSYVYYYQFPVDPQFNDFKDSDRGQTPLDIHSIAKKAFENMDINGRKFLPPSQIDKLIDLKPEGYLPLRKLQHKGESSVVRFYLEEPVPELALEQEANAAFKRLLVKAPRVVFLTGNNERNLDSKADRHYQVAGVRGTRRIALINQGFDVTTVNLGREVIPVDTNIVVLGDPTVALGAAEQAKIEAYLNGGGNMLIAGEPGRQQVLNPLLKRLGVHLREGIVVVPNKDITPGFLRTTVSSDAPALGSFIDSILRRRAAVAIHGASAVDASDTGGFSIKPLLLAPAGSRIEEGEMKRSPLTGDIDVSTMTFNPDTASGAETGMLAISVFLTRIMNGRPQRIVVSGDADFMSNSELDRGGLPAQRYLHGIFQWLSHDEFPVDSPTVPPSDVDLLVSRETIKVWMWISKAGIPALLIIAGMIILFRRRAK